MAFKDYLTVDGERLLTLAAAGTKITFTRLVMGSGNIDAGTSEKNMTAVITPIRELPIQSVSINDSSSVAIQSYYNNSEVTQGFYFREKGIYASDGEKEVLAIYGNARSTAEYIDTPDIVVIEKKIRTILMMTSDEIQNITLSNATNAMAPILRDTTLEDFVKSTTAQSIEVGQVVILNKIPYTYVGYDYSDKNCYVLGGGNGDRQGSVTVISEDMLSVTTTYEDGTKSEAVFSEDLKNVEEKQYDAAGNVIATYETTIEGNTITERVI